MGRFCYATMPHKRVTRSYSKSSAGKAHKRWEITNRRRSVALLLDAGLEQKDIAQELQVSRATVSKDVAALRAAAAATTDRTMQARVEREEAQLDADELAFRAEMDSAGTATGRRAAYEAILSIQRRRADLLGLDASERRKLQDSEAGKEALDELLARAEALE